MGCPPSPTNSVRSRRDQVWEMKRQRFLSKQASGGHTDIQSGARSRPPPMSSDIFGGAPSSMFGAAPAPAPAPAPSSPLSKLVQQGYPPAGARDSPTSKVEPMRPTGGGCPPALPGSRGSAGAGGLGRQDSFDANVAQQWSSNVQSTLAQHQQQNDPNYHGCYKKPSGYRVSQAPGGGSSISLSWGGDDSGAVCHAGRGQRAPSPSHAAGRRAPSPSYGGGRPPLGGTGSQREASPFAVAGRASSGQREPSPFAGSRGGGGQRDPSPFAAGGRAPSPHGGNIARSCPFGVSDPEPRYGAGNALGGGRPPVPLPRNDSRELGPLGGGGVASAMNGGPSYGSSNNAAMGGGPAFGGGGAIGGVASAMNGGPAVGGGGAMGGGSAFGSRQDYRSSNAYACGANQNCGNFVTDRRTTRISAPPGGRSQISFG